MKCQQCVQAGVKSKVFVPATRLTPHPTSVPFYDEEGVYHHHDETALSEIWTCSNGHVWTRWYYRFCPQPACDWNATRQERIELMAV